MAATTSITRLCGDRVHVERNLERLFAGEDTRGDAVVYQAMRYSVFGSGQRIRPILALRVARILGNTSELTMRAAMSIELLHCASLIVDDLPCMDNSYLRRNRATVHVRFGEAAALLAAFGLVALSARTLSDYMAETEQIDSLIRFQSSLLRTLDCSCLIAGQALDLALTPQSSHVDQERISELKTVPLFKLAVSAGSLGRKLSPDEKALLSGFAHEFGLAFQMSDDLQDGEAADLDAFEDKLTILRAAAAPFGLASLELLELVDYLHLRATSERPN